MIEKEKIADDEILEFNSGYTSQLKRVICKPARVAVAKVYKIPKSIGINAWYFRKLRRVKMLIKI